MLGLSFAQVNYNWRLSVLTSIKKEHRDTQLLKNKTEVFAKSYVDLFKDSFREEKCSSLNVKQKSHEVSKNESISPIRRTFPFWGDPPLENRRGKRGWKLSFLSKHCHKHPTKVKIHVAPCLNTPQLLDVV